MQRRYEDEVKKTVCNETEEEKKWSGSYKTG